MYIHTIITDVLLSSWRMLRIATRKRHYTHDLRQLNNCTRPKCASMESIADTIVDNARRIGLSVCADLHTPGDVNCFYHSVLQQLARPEIQSGLPTVS